MDCLPMLWHFGSKESFCEFRDRLLHTANDERKAIVLELVRRVGGRVIMRITKRRRVGDHESGIATLPERPLVGPSDAREE